MIQRCNRIKGIVITGTPPVDDPDEVDKAFTFGSGGWKEAAPARMSGSHLQNAVMLTNKVPQFPKKRSRCLLMVQLTHHMKTGWSNV